MFLSTAARAAQEALERAGGRVYAVGGCVRDMLLVREPKDYDLLVAGLPENRVLDALESIPGRVDYTGVRFGVYRYRRRDEEVEVALPRTDEYDGRRGRGRVVVDHRLPVEADLRRRDFTVNAMAVEPYAGSTVIDPTGGLDDLHNGVLRAAHPRSFEEDPTRLVRALAMVSRFGLLPDTRTADEMTTAAPALRGESPDALNQAVDKWIGADEPALGLYLAHDTDVLAYLFGTLWLAWDYDQKNPHHDLTIGRHSAEALRIAAELTDDVDVRLAALLHDVGKPQSAWDDDDGVRHYYRSDDGRGADHAAVGAGIAATELGRLNFPAARISRVAWLVQHHMFPDFESRRGARRFIQRVGNQHADDLLDLREADSRSKLRPGAHRVDEMRALVQAVREAGEPTDVSQLAIDGRDVIAAGVPEGPRVGAVLRRLADMAVEEPVLNDRETLLALARVLRDGAQA